MYVFEREKERGRLWCLIFEVTRSAIYAQVHPNQASYIGIMAPFGRCYLYDMSYISFWDPKKPATTSKAETSVLKKH